MQRQTAPPQRDWVWIGALILVTALALILRWYYVSTAKVIDPIRADAAQYYRYAWNLAHHAVFSGAASDAARIVPDNYRDPGYPLLLAAWMKLFSNEGYWYAAVLFTQAALGALTVPLTMLLGRHWLGRGWATGAGLLIALWPHNIVIASNILSETLFGFLCALAVLLAAEAFQRCSRWWSLSAGIAFGAAALTNAVLLPFGILLALYLAWRRLAPRRVWLALMVGAALLPGAWAIRNLQLPPAATGHTSTDRALQNLVQGSWPAYHAAYVLLAHGDQRGADVFRAINAEYALLRSSPTLGARAILHRMSERPWRYLEWYTLHKPRVFWGWRIRVGQNDMYVYAAVRSPFDRQPAMRTIAAVAHTINPLLALLMLGCLVAAIVPHRQLGRAPPHRQAARAAVLWLALYATVVYSLLQADPRYSIPFRPFEMLLAMTACSGLALWLADMRQRPGLPAPPSPPA